MNTEHIFSTSLKESLLQISTVAHDEDIPEQKKAEKLIELSKPALELLDELIEDVGGTRRLLLEQLRGVIESGNWAVLPSPNDVQLSIDKIIRITVALNDVQKNLMADASEIFRTLMEIMRDMALKSKFEQGKQHIEEMEAVKKAAINRKAANEKQKSAELATSIAQCLGGIASLGGSVGSMVHAGKALGKAKDSTKSLIGSAKNEKGLLASDGKTLSMNSEPSVQKATSVPTTPSKPISQPKQSSVDGATNVSKHNPGPGAKADSHIDAPENNTDIPANTRNAPSSLQSDPSPINKGHKYLDTDEEDGSQETLNAIPTSRSDVSESKRVQSDIHLAKGNAGQSLAGALASLINSSGGTTSAVQKKEASDFQAEADTDQVMKETAGKRYQGEGDSANSMRDAIKAAIGTMSAIEQTSSSLGSLISRNSV